MASTDIIIPASKIYSRLSINVKITGLTTRRFRMAVGIWLIKFAARIMGVGIHVEVDGARQA